MTWQGPVCAPAAVMSVTCVCVQETFASQLSASLERGSLSAALLLIESPEANDRQLLTQEVRRVDGVCVCV